VVDQSHRPFLLAQENLSMPTIIFTGHTLGARAWLQTDSKHYELVSGICEQYSSLLTPEPLPDPSHLEAAIILHLWAKCKLPLPSTCTERETLLAHLSTDSNCCPAMTPNLDPHFFWTEIEQWLKDPARPRLCGGPRLIPRF
jgi:hypothetical protein